MPNSFAINGAEINGSGLIQIDVRIAVASPLGNAAPVIFHDWTSLIPDYAVNSYVMDVDGATLQRIPISSWQGTIQIARSNYLQAVIPACGAYVDYLTAEVGSDFIIYKIAQFDGQSFQSEIARSSIDTPRTDRGGTNYTCTISGYNSATTGVVSSNLSRRTLQGVQSISTYNGGLRVRCEIDWFLKPGQTAIVDGVEFTVSYINYIVNDSGAYMDAGESQV